VTEDKAKALDMFDKGEEGFIDRDLYVGPGTDTPLEKTSYYTKVGDQVCGVGYYKE
jgi:hypothetical protein